MEKEFETKKMDVISGNAEAESIEIEAIAINCIYSFENHPFKVEDDEKMDELVDSIKANGVLNPVIVRRDKEDSGLFEMVSGHRRQHAAKRAGLQKIPAIVKEMTDDEAIILMVDSNIQREEILPSEKAFSYKMKLEAMKRQGERNDLGEKSIRRKCNQGETSTQVGRKLESAEELGVQMGISKNQVRRYIRLTELIPEFLALVDEKKLPMATAVEISYLTRKIQNWLYKYMEENGITKSKTISELRKGIDQSEVSREEFMDYLKGLKEIPAPPKKIVLTEKVLNKYFTGTMTMGQKEDIILRLLQEWKMKNSK